MYIYIGMQIAVWESQVTIEGERVCFPRDMKDTALWMNLFECVSGHAWHTAVLVPAAFFQRMPMPNQVPKRVQAQSTRPEEGETSEGM